MKRISEIFMKYLDVDEVIAHLLATEGFSSIEDVANADSKAFKVIEGFDEKLIAELKGRAIKSVKIKNKELEEKKIISDERLIQEFPDEIIVPTNVSGNFMNKSFNSILSKLSKKVKKKII